MLAEAMAAAARPMEDVQLIGEAGAAAQQEPKVEENGEKNEENMNENEGEEEEQEQEEQNNGEGN